MEGSIIRKCEMRWQDRRLESIFLVFRKVRISSKSLIIASIWFIFYTMSMRRVILPPNDCLMKSSFWFWKVFGQTAGTIVSGSVAERMKFSTYVAYNSLICFFLYPVVSHWYVFFSLASHNIAGWRHLFFKKSIS